MRPDEEEKPDISGRRKGHLRPVKMRSGVVRGCLATAIASAAGLALITGWSPSVWLFLLYPVLIGALLISLGVLGLNLLNRF